MNTKLAERLRQVATYLFLGTMVLLVGGFIFVNYSLFSGNLPGPLIVLLQLLLIPAAFILTIVSVRLTNLWARRPFPEEIIKDNLKGISKRSILYHYYHFPARHVLIAPQGVFAIITRWHNGRIENNEGHWKEHKNPLGRFFSMMRMDGLGNPTQDALKAAQHVQDELNAIGADVEVQPLIIFTDPTVELTIENPTVPIFVGEDNDLIEYMRELNREQRDDIQSKATLPLTDEQIEAFEANTVT